jgi:hypothetical protein
MESGDGANAPGTDVQGVEEGGYQDV